MKSENKETYSNPLAPEPERYTPRREYAGPKRTRAGRISSILVAAGIAVSSGFGCNSVEPVQIETPKTEEYRQASYQVYFGDKVPNLMRDEIIKNTKFTSEWFASKKIPLPEDIDIVAFNESDSPITQMGHPFRREIATRDRNNTAWADPDSDTIFINTSSKGWAANSPVIAGSLAAGRLYIDAHEKFLLAISEMGGDLQTIPAYMTLGSAHFIAGLVTVDSHHYTYERIREGHVSEALKVNEPLSQLATLKQVKSAGRPNKADEYSLFFLLHEYLIKGKPNRGIDAIKKYYQLIAKEGDHKLAIKEAFGIENLEKEFQDFRHAGFRTFQG